MNSQQRRLARRAEARETITATQAMRPAYKPKGSNRSSGNKFSQRNSVGGQSEWSQPANLPYSVSAVASDPKWSQTTSNTNP